MSLLEVLSNYLVSKGICVGDGEDCFRDFTPEQPDDTVVLYEYGSDQVFPYTTNVHRSVQIRVRMKDAGAARAKAVLACAAFRSTTEDNRIDFDSTNWAQVYIRQLPFKLLQDESDRVTYCFNLGITTNIIE